MTEKNEGAAVAPAQFLQQLASDLVGQPSVDHDLAQILSAHILNSSPQSDGVANARNAIGNLARSRAAQTSKGS